MTEREDVGEMSSTINMSTNCGYKEKMYKRIHIEHSRLAYLYIAKKGVYYQ